MWPINSSPHSTPARESGRFPPGEAFFSAILSGSFAICHTNWWRPSNRRLRKLGRHKGGKGCLYIRQLADVDTKVLEEIIVRGVRYLKGQA